jgi:transcriptional regulator with XRE-family HTH domain
MHVGEKLKYWRQERRFMSIRGLAKEANVKPTTISDIERGKRIPRHETLESLVKALGITLDDLANTRPGPGRRVA